MTRLFRISAVALLVLTLLPACSLLKKKDGEATGPIEPAQITVHNRNVLDVNIIAYRGTERIRLGTAITVLPWHNPVLVAEQAATVDLLSGGRFDFGVGKGYRFNVNEALL